MDAEYSHGISSENTSTSYDQFLFSINISDTVSQEAKRMLLCVRYKSFGQEFWDNNDGMDFQVGFQKKNPEQ